MSRKICKRKKITLTLEPDGFSIHTFELSMQLTKDHWNRCKDSLYREQQHLGAHWIYPDHERKGQHFCTRYADAGIRIRLEHVKENGESRGFFVRLTVNPKKLIYPQSSYLGILPPTEESVELLEKVFASLLRDSPFERDIRRYYLKRVDLCTNIRCGSKRVFREMVRLLRKTATPKRYRRKLYRHPDKKKAARYNKHYIRIACDTQELVIYDKTYQMTENELTVRYEEMPSGVLRVEVHYGRDKLKEIEKDLGNEDPLDVITLLIGESRERILKLAEKCYADLSYCSIERLREQIGASTFRQTTKDRMLTLAELMRKKQTLDAALQYMEKQGIKTDDLLKKFQKLGVNPVPLLAGFAAERMPSLPELLRTVGEHPMSVELTTWKWK